MMAFLDVMIFPCRTFTRLCQCLLCIQRWEKQSLAFQTNTKISFYIQTDMQTLGQKFKKKNKLFKLPPTNCLINYSFQ